MTSLLQRWWRPRAAARKAVASVAAQNWLVTNASDLEAAFEEMRTGAAALTGAGDIRAAMDYAEQEAIDAKPYAVQDGVAIFHIQGLIMREVPCAMRFFGIAATSTLEVQAALERAVADPEVGALFFLFDTPGGVMGGVDELAGAIREAGTIKATFGHVPTLAASAGYWIGAQVAHLTADRTAALGSIGVYTVLVDSSRAHEEAGFTVHRLASGAEKGIGVPGTEITEEQLALEQSLVNQAADLFKVAVKEGRPSLTAEKLNQLATGRVWFGGDALELGLIDGLATTGEAFEAARQAAAGAHVDTPVRPIVAPRPAPDGAGGSMKNTAAAPSGGTDAGEARLAAFEQRLAALETENEALKGANKALNAAVDAEKAKAAIAEKGLQNRVTAVLEAHQKRGAFDPAEREEMEALSKRAFAADPEGLDAYLARLPSKNASPRGATGTAGQRGANAAIPAEAARHFAHVGITDELWAQAEETSKVSLIRRERVTSTGEVLSLVEEVA